MASEVLRIRIRADSGNTAAVFNDISRNILGMTVGAAGARSGMMGLGAALSGAQITGRLAAAMFGAAAYGVYSMGSAMIQAAGAQDQFRVSMAALLKDTSKVDAVTAAVKRFADSTSFSNDAVFQVAQNLVAAKVPLQNLIPTLQMLGDVSLGNAEKFSGIATAWYQIIAKGKLTAEEINQIAERGVSVWSILAEETGKSVPELQKLAEAGKLTVDAYMPILQRGLAKNYAGSLKEASNLSTNLLVNISKSITNFAAAIGSGLGDTVNPFLQFLAQAFQRAALYAKALTQSAIWARFTQALQAAAEALAPIIKGIGIAGFIGLIRVVQILTPAMYFLAAAFRGISAAASQAMQFLKPLTDTFSRIAARIKQLDWQGLWTSIKSQSSDIGTKIVELLKQVVLTAWTTFKDETLPQLRATGKELISKAWDFLSGDESVMTAIRTWFFMNVTGIGPILMALFKANVNWATILGSLIAVADIMKGLENNDWGLLAQGLVELIIPFIANAKFGPVGALIGIGLAQAFFMFGYPSWQAALAAGDWEPFAQILLVLLPAVFLLKRGQFGTAIGAALVGQELIDAMSDVFKKGDYSKVGTALLDGILLGLALGGWTMIVGALSKGWTWVIATFAALLPRIGSAIALAIFDLFVFLETTFGTALGLLTGAAVLAAIAAVGYRLYKAFENVFTTGIDWKQLFVAGLALAAGAIVLGFLGLPGLVIAAAVTAMTAIFGVDLVDAATKQLGKFIPWLENEIKTGFVGTWQAVKSWMTEGGFSILLASAIGAVIAAVVLAPTAFLALAGGIVGGIIAALVIYWADIKQWFSDAWTGIVQWIKDLLGISSPSKVFADLGTNVIEGLYLGLTDGLAAGWDAFVNTLTSWGTDITIWFQTWSGGFASTLFEIFSKPDSMTKGIEAMWNGAKNLVASTLDSIIEYFRSWSTGDFAKKLQDFFGADVISNAIRNGLKAAWESAKGILSSFVTDAKNAVSNAFSGMTGGGGGGGGGNSGGGMTRDEYYWDKKNSGISADQADAMARAKYGFAMGGSFRVGGFGGTDSQLVQFRASPNETVTIRRPDQAGGGLVIQTLNVYADSYQGGQDAARAIRDALGGQRKMLFATT